MSTYASSIEILICEAIRRKIENELSRKRGAPKRTRLPTKAGTVSALRPSAALTVRDNISVAEASQLMAAKRADCVLVVDGDDHLSGIFTAKDLAFRVVGDGLDYRTTSVSQIMTKNPMLTRSDTSATDALNTMVSRGFRHLPVCNEEGDVVGLLDITKVFHEALEKLERAYESSSKLYSALEGVQSEWASGNQPMQLINYVEQLREKMSSPDLTTVMDGDPPAMVTVRTSVKEAAMMMKERHTTAVCVMDSSNAIAGIFTSKDIVLRVIAAGLDPRTCSVVRVMTPHPDVSSPTTSIQVALRKMHDGHYLNLPVVEADGRVTGCVNILQLTYATLEQINSIQGGSEGGSGGGPMWNKFWDSFGQGETESVHSDSHVRSVGEASSPALPTTGELPEVHPNESASAYDGDTTSQLSTEQNRLSSTLYDEGVFAFKFKAPSGKVHRFQCDYSSVDSLRQTVAEKLNGEEIGSDPRQPFNISYVDDEGDYVVVTTNHDVADAVQLAKKQKADRVLLYVHDPSTKKEELPTPPVVEMEREPSLDKPKPEEKKAEVFGLPQEFLLPGAIALLAVAIIGVALVSRSVR